MPAKLMRGGRAKSAAPISQPHPKSLVSSKIKFILLMPAKADEGVQGNVCSANSHPRPQSFVSSKQNSNYKLFQY